jgi:hypothetical protein
VHLVQLVQLAQLVQPARLVHLVLFQSEQTKFISRLEQL